MEKKKKRTVWVRDLYLKRETIGQFHTLVQELRISDPEMHFKYFRMGKEGFDELLRIVEQRLIHNSLRKPISPAERLALTLRFLASGNDYTSLSFNYRIAVSTISKIIPEVTRVIWEELQLKVMAKPTEEEWKQIVRVFWNTWNFPNCSGSIDGRHVPIQCPANSGTAFFNYKQTFSINLMAACDADYCFTMIDVGSTGRNNDGAVLRLSAFGQQIFNHQLGIPRTGILPGTDEEEPIVFTADEAFPLTENILRPYPGKGLTHIKQGLGELLKTVSGFWSQGGVYYVSKCVLHKKTADYVILASCCLHNYLRKREKHLISTQRQYRPPAFVDTENEDGEIILGEWRQHVPDEFNVSSIMTSSNNYTKNAAQMRDRIANYFVGPVGRVDWQDAYVNRGRENDR